MTARYPQYFPLGDSAVTVVLGEGISRTLSYKVLRVVDGVRSANVPAITEVVPSYASFAVFYNPLLTTYTRLVDSLRDIESVSVPPGEGSQRIVKIPVRYDGEDLEEVAQRTSHTVEEVIALHSARTYYAYVIGFVPGWTYLGEIDSSLVLPRRSAPRKRVPQGSVAIAETQTGVYPFATPGGWHLLGTTDVRMFDPNRAEPSLIRVGDLVVFEPIR